MQPPEHPNSAQSASVVAAQPSATVVVMRDTPQGGWDCLMMQRRGRDFLGGSWVFPGGRIDAGDYPPSRDLEEAARRAAVRETREESGLALEAAALVHFSHWTTPEESPKRYATWFFCAHLEEVEGEGGKVTVTPCPREMHDYRWLHPAEAMEEQRRGRLQIPPPTFVTLHQLAAYPSAAAACSALREQPVAQFHPRLEFCGEDLCLLYEGDAGYPHRDPQASGARHRLWMPKEGPWRYQNTKEDI